MSDNTLPYSGPAAGRPRREQARDELIERLHLMQQERGWLDREGLRRLAHELDLPPSRVYGVASFYHAFRLSPPGANQCTVCTGTSCHIKGGTRLVRELEQHLGIPCGTVREDGMLSLNNVRCLGHCEQAPLVMINDESLGGGTVEETLEEVVQQLERLGITGSPP